MKKENLYHTKKRSEIIKYIEDNKDSHICVEDIIAYINSGGESINKSTVYRYLKVLVDEGKIRKYVIDEKAKACYQVGHNHDCSNLLHLKCTKCNELFHISLSSYKLVIKEIEDNFNFNIDNSKTVLYGVCQKCGGKDEKYN